MKIYLTCQMPPVHFWTQPVKGPGFIETPRGVSIMLIAESPPFPVK